MITELNQNSLNTNLSDILDFEYTLPNITATTLPIHVLLANYLAENKKYDEAIDYLDLKIKSNPHFYVKDYFKAIILSRMDSLDSAKIYAKKAFYSFPNAIGHQNTYFGLLGLTRDSLEIEKAFDFVKKKKMGTWEAYFLAVLTSKANNEFHSTLLDSVYSENKTNSNLEKLWQRMKLGDEDYFNSTLNKDKADNLLDENHNLDAIRLYREIIKLNPYMYDAYENIGIAFFKEAVYDSAQYYFNKTQKHFPNKTKGKSEFYLGMILIDKKNYERGCFYLNASQKKGYKDSESYIRIFCKK